MVELHDGLHRLVIISLLVLGNRQGGVAASMGIVTVISDAEAGRYDSDTAVRKAMREGQRLATSIRGVGTESRYFIVDSCVPMMRSAM